MAKDLNNNPGTSHVDDSSEMEGLLRHSKKPCRTCVDFKTWMKDRSKESGEQSRKTEPKTTEAPSELTRHECPLDINELGRNTWGFLHTMAANYPEKPTPEEQGRVKTLMSSFSYLYPCDMCAYDFRKRLKKTPVETESQHSLSQWMCRMHNQINTMLGKKTFDCSRVNERWRDGWDDGSCG